MLSMDKDNHEQVVFVDATERDARIYQVVHIVASESIRVAYSENRLKSVKSVRKQAPIDAGLAKALSRTWFCAVAQSRYVPLRVGVPYKAILDGTTYEAGTSVIGAGWASASTTSPDSGSVAGRLVALGGLLIDYVNFPEADRQRIQATLRTNVESLWSDLLARAPDSEVCKNLVDG
jgi:hypothetical protein